jgi:dTDP-4-amino-4,6-dideoxy-D-galactose acyltransferase
MTDAAASLNLLPWDSEFFGVRIARLSGSTLHESQLSAIEGWCRTRGVKCLYFLADGMSPETLKAVYEGGFKFADVRTVFELSMAGFANRESQEPSVRIAAADDMGVLQEMARSLHKNTRFFKDSNFPHERAAELYAEWLRRSFRDPKGTVLAAMNSAGELCGYVACETGEMGHIGLIGVAESSRGQGVGSALVRAALAWLSSVGVSRVRVATQSDNVAAVRLYLAHGFSLVETGVWFHRWYV